MIALIREKEITHMPIDCPRPHTGPHRLAWEHGVDPRLRTAKLWQHIEQAIHHADTDNDEVQVAVVVVRGIIDRHRNTCGLIDVDDDELAAIKLAVSDACEYMAINNYADDDSFPGDAAAAAVLQSGEIAWVCWRDLVREAS